ncbi:MAG: acetate--CoA ligase family protein [Pseudomonadota bacterium]
MHGPIAAQHPLEPLFRPRAVVFVGGSNLSATLRYHREQGFAGETWVLNAKYRMLEGFPCFPAVEDLPGAPDLAFLAIRREAAIDTIAALRHRGCRAVVAMTAGFAETGAEGAGFQAQFLEAVGDMAALGPNTLGLINCVEPMAAMMDHLGVRHTERGVAIVSQGGGLICDAVFADRGLEMTHMLGCGNQAKTTVADCVDYLLDHPGVTAVGLAFEGLPDTGALRRAAVKALRLGKPIVAMKFGRTDAGARAAASHTASMAGEGAAWQALFDRLGIVSVTGVSEFFEVLKLFHSGQIPKGRRALVTAASGVMGVLLADHLSAAGFEMPQPSPATVERLRSILPGIATPGNPQDITMAAWNDRARQAAIYDALMAEGYDIAMMVQNYPRDGMWDIAEYAAQLEALAEACRGRDVAAMQLAPLVDCYPAAAREETVALGLAPMQGLSECLVALDRAAWWRGRRETLIAEAEALGLDALPAPAAPRRLDEAAAKALLAAAGLPVPAGRLVAADEAAAAAEAIGFPVALKAVDARLLHKTEAGAVRLGLRSAVEVAEAVTVMRKTMARKVPGIPLSDVLVEAMAADVVAEVMASVRHDPFVGPVMMIAGGGVEAELWNDHAVIAFPVTEAEVETALDSLKIAAKLVGWRGRPAGDREALVAALMALARFAEAQAGRLEEVEINPILVGQSGVCAVDAVLSLEVGDG